jgi:hypothetical protein
MLKALGSEVANLKRCSTKTAGAVMKVVSQTEPIPVKEGRPKPGQWVILVTQWFRCMGYLDGAGRWREIMRHEEVKGVTAWYPIDSDC